MALSDEDIKEVRALVRQEINKAVGTILANARKANVSPDAINAIENHITYSLVKGYKEAQAEAMGDSPQAKISSHIIPEDEKLGTY
ncbi:MAG: hypothetical protein M3367_03340 [Acidobacteriota bacterium]|nr:hypothetical protein [Acidobacteriota bacterium]